MSDETTSVSSVVLISVFFVYVYLKRGSKFELLQHGTTRSLTSFCLYAYHHTEKDIVMITAWIYKRRLAFVINLSQPCDDQIFMFNADITKSYWREILFKCITWKLAPKCWFLYFHSHKSEEWLYIATWYAVSHFILKMNTAVYPKLMFFHNLLCANAIDMNFLCSYVYLHTRDMKFSQ
jgi:hypothetical protein